MLNAITTYRSWKYPDVVYNKVKANALGLTLNEFMEIYQDNPEEIVYVYSLHTKVYVGVLSPGCEDYKLLYSENMKEAILHTDDELPTVRSILDRHNIKYDITAVDSKAEINIAFDENQMIKL